MSLRLLIQAGRWKVLLSFCCLSFSKYFLLLANPGCGFPALPLLLAALELVYVLVLPDPEMYGEWER